MEPIEEKPTEQEEKLEEYLELLDTIEDPNVTELTLLGEAAFDANDSASAYDHYLEVIEEHSDDPMAPFALYKFAWVQFNLGDVSAAIDDMALMLEWVDVGETAMDEAMISVASKDLEFFRTKAE